MTPHNLTCITVPANSTGEYEQNIPELLDASSPEPDTMQFTVTLPKTDWPDAPTIQIPSVSSMTADAPPEVVYHCRTTVYMADGQEVPEIKEDNDEYEYNNNNPHLITHPNTHQESERIRREYSAKLQDLDDKQYYDKVDRTLELQYSLLAASYDPPE